jgi:type IV pilus assembly protein PilQ
MSHRNKTKDCLGISLFLIFIFFLASTHSFAAEEALQKGSGSLTFDFKKIAVRELLQFIAESMNCNLMMSDNVSGFISIHLNNVTWQQAFDGILEMAGLVKKYNNHILFVGTPNEFALRQKLLAEAVPVKLVEIKLRHIDANVAYSLLKNHSELFSSNAQITINPHENSLWIKENMNNIPILKRYLHQIDKFDQQILIAAKIINIDNNKIQELGIRFNEKPSKQTSNNLSLSLPHVELNSFQLAILTAAQNELLNLQLCALEATGHSKIVASPKIITQNHKLATIESGEEIPYPESTSSGATNITFKKAVLSLKVKPSLLPDGHIILELEINQNKVSPLAVNGVPAIQTQEVKTEVAVRSDQTVVLGGIFEKAAASSENKIPAVSRLPLIGRFFTHREGNVKTKQLLVFISPHVMIEHK